MYLSRLVFIYSSQKRELFVVNTSVLVQSTISLKIETRFSWGEEKKISYKWKQICLWSGSMLAHWVEFWWCLSRTCPWREFLSSSGPFSQLFLWTEKMHDGPVPSKMHVNIKDVWGRIPLRSSRRWGFPLSRGVSPYLLQMLTWAPLVTRSWGKGQNRIGEILYITRTCTSNHHQGEHQPQPLGLVPRNRHNAAVCFHVRWLHLCLPCTGSTRKKQKQRIICHKTWSGFV